VFKSPTTKPKGCWANNWLAEEKIKAQMAVLMGLKFIVVIINEKKQNYGNDSKMPI
jgi:hypothetical protein